MILIAGVKAWIGPDAEDDFNSWSLEHPEVQIKSVQTEFKTEGKYDGDLSIIVLYAEERKILPFPKVVAG